MQSMNSASRLSRRALLACAASAALPLRAAKSKLKLGVTDWNLHLGGKLEAVELAKKLGFAGVEISLGRTPVDDKLRLANAAIQDDYLAALRQNGIAAAGVCLDILHVNYLKSDKLGQKWVAASIPIAKRLNAGVVLLPFFGRGSLNTEDERMFVADFLKEVAPEAARAGVTLGLENMCSAEQNARILDRAGSRAVKVYYDVGNSTMAGWDILKEIPWLGASRICQFHLKDNPSYLGEGKIQFPAVMNTIMNLGFEGFANLETDPPSNSVEADMKRNLDYVQRLIG